MNNLEKLGGHFLETEVQQWHCSLGGEGDCHSGTVLWGR